MDRLTKRILPTAVASAVALLTLIGYLVPLDPLVSIRDHLIRWAVIIASFALVLGLLNLFRVHSSRLLGRQKGWPYSLALLLAALASFGITAAGLLLEPMRPLSALWFNSVLYPLQASAGGLVAFVLGLAAFRLVRSRRPNGLSETLLLLTFVLSALIVLLGTAPLPGPVGDLLASLRQLWMRVPALAGMRGLLIGVGLGTLVMGLRVVFWLDRPHSEP